MESSLMMFQALRARKIASELHVFESGGHGFGLTGPRGVATRLARPAERLPQAARPLRMTRARFDVRDFGARGDGASLATDAINAAIAFAHAAGGGEGGSAGWALAVVLDPPAQRRRPAAGRRLRAGGRRSARHAGAYDPAEANPFDLYRTSATATGATA